MEPCNLSMSADNSKHPGHILTWTKYIISPMLPVGNPKHCQQILVTPNHMFLIVHNLIQSTIPFEPLASPSNLFIVVVSLPRARPGKPCLITIKPADIQYITFIAAIKKEQSRSQEIHHVQCHITDHSFSQVPIDMFHGEALYIYIYLQSTSAF